MRRVERHRFVPESIREHAYEDRPLGIGHGQTISQPYIVAVMTEAARVRPGARVLEIGTGSGYQAAVLAELAGEVDTIELVEPLAKEAAARLVALGYRNVNVRAGDGYRGWPERAPFDVILVTAAPPEIPQPLLDQLAVGGRLVAPVGEREQELVVVKRTEAGLSRRTLLPVRFVPMTGEAQQRQRRATQPR
jgi:protein-L-isoaspartate(D-aspartate) O-methyltransferase